MKTTNYLLAAALVAIGLSATSCNDKKGNFRLLYWNIQNGMWDGQGDNYGRFVNFVASQRPDVCVWCEAQSVFKTDSEQDMAPEDRYLVKNWGDLAARYGHKYWGIGGQRDNYPQVITSKYPIKYVDRIIGAKPDSVVAHGAGWATIEVNGKNVNIVTLHTWPKPYARKASDRAASEAENGGDKYRKMEIEYICNHTIGAVPEAEGQLWMMLGDFNAVSRADNFQYHFPEDSLCFLVHDYIRENTPYADVIRECYGDEYVSSCVWDNTRIDFVYATKPLYSMLKHAEIIWNNYTTPVRDPQGLGNFWRPSDHLPIVLDFDIN